MIFNKRRFRVPTCVERDEAYTINKKKILTKVPVCIRREEDDELQGREKSKCKAKEIQLAEERLLS